METKRFTIVDTRSNNIKTINSNATTIAELKRDFTREGINFADMAIQEGLTHIELDMDNDSFVLPTNVPMRNGSGTTNNLVFRITQKSKKIKSGAMTRKEAYEYIKAHNLADVIAKKYGRNYTVVKTDELVKTIEETTCNTGCQAQPCNVANVLTELINKLVSTGTISDMDGVELTDMLGTQLNTYVGEYTKSEIDAMFADMDEY